MWIELGSCIATREQQVTMLAVWRKPPGEEPEGSRPSATSLVVHALRGDVRSINGRLSYQMA
ncbi:hypothetical protein RISK_003065 [Rhodopirellula islandica]|uniref:Uncharacterized protein n=1 Tax=Rhodopirellula islandica TaxID=595434 RepID=A0A0J1BDX8_RHOIS|nr:hypothetical protein RISK_003065 [Rhodopirellula islandica]